jgi:hypothetical protein
MPDRNINIIISESPDRQPVPMIPKRIIDLPFLTKYE